MSTYNRTSFLVTKGNLPVKPAGEKVYYKPTKTTPGGVNVQVGELVVFDPTRNVTLAPADLATAKSVSVAVGWDGDNDGMADELRYLIGERFNLCDTTFKARATPANCGCPQVLDFYIDCVSPDQVYTLTVYLWDAYTEDALNTNEPIRYDFTISVNTDACDDCTFEQNCEEIICKLVDKINGRVNDDPTCVTRFPRADRARLTQYQPFRAARLFENSFSYDLALIDTECADCEFVQSVGGVVVEGTTITFDGTVDPSDPTRSFPKQLKRISALINQALDPIGGSAYVTTSPLKCCPYKIEVNTCDPTFQLLDGELNPITGTNENPFMTFANENECRGCGDDPEDSAPTCALRLFVDPYEVDCDCLPDANPIPRSFYRRISVEGTGSGFESVNTWTKEICELELPVGLGYVYQDLEMMTDAVGGRGRDHRYGNYHVGTRYYTPDKFSRARATATDCEEAYCPYDIVIEQTTKRKFINALKYTNCNHGVILVPQADTATQTSWEVYLNTLSSLGVCSSFATCQEAMNDVVEGATVGAASTVDVSANDTIDCTTVADGDPGVLTYRLVGEPVNATVDDSGAPSFVVTPIARGEFSFQYEVLCDDKVADYGVVKGIATA